MRAIAIAIVAGTALVAAESDPAGTTVLRLEMGQSAPLSAAPGANVLCDDPGVVAPDFADDAGGFVLHALRAGTTLCGIWLAGGKPGGLYRVTVTAKAGDGGPAPPTDAGLDGG